jgi:carbonic anhydrase
MSIIDKALKANQTYAKRYDRELGAHAKLCALTGDASPAPMRFFSYKAPEEHTREQIKKVRSHPWIAKDIPVRGFILDEETGGLREVKYLNTSSPLDPRSLFIIPAVASASATASLPCRSLAQGV